MTSIGEDVYVGTLNADTINYNTLNPALTGFVHNPLTGDLFGAANSIDLQGGDLTADTINYTNLNPPIPASGVFNPLTANLDGGNFNITNVNGLTSSVLTTSTLTASSTAGGNITGSTINIGGGSLTCGNISSGAVSATGGTFSGAVSASSLTATNTVQGQDINSNDSITAGGTITGHTLQATNQITATNASLLGLTVSGPMTSGAITTTDTIRATSYVESPLIVDIGTSLSWPNPQRRDFIILTTTTGSILGTPTITISDAVPDREGGTITVSLYSLQPAIPFATPVSFNLTYTSYDTSGANPVPSTIPLTLNPTIIKGQFVCLRATNGRLEWITL